MNSILSIAMSALRAFRTKFESTASNIANVNTEDYKSYNVKMNEGTHGGVEAEVTRSEDAYMVDISKEMVDMIVTEKAIKANLKVIKEEDERLENTIDLIV